MKKDTNITITSGIYAIRNLKNGKVYIGQAMDIEDRWKKHKSALNNGYHHNSHLQAAWKRYGADAFEFGIIEECDESRLDERETHHIATYRSKGFCYNLTDGGCGTRGHVHTDESRQKISKARVGKSLSYETRKRMSAAQRGNKKCLGKITSVETRKKLSEAAKKRPRISDATRLKLSEASKGNRNCVGRILSEETRRKMSDAHRNISEETRLKMSESAKRRHKPKLESTQ